MTDNKIISQASGITILFADETGIEERPQTVDTSIEEPDNDIAELTETGLIWRESISAEQWVAMGLQIRQNRIKLDWAAIDWLLLGMARFEDWVNQIQDNLLYEKPTIDNMRRIGEAFPAPDTRVAGLTPSYHEAVVAVKNPDDRKALLEHGRKQGLKRDEFRKYVKEWRGLPTPPKPHTDYAEVIDGTVYVEHIPPGYEGRRVRVTISIDPYANED